MNYQKTYRQNLACYVYKNNTIQQGRFRNNEQILSVRRRKSVLLTCKNN